MAKITVRNTSTGALAKLYSARDGSAPKANPFNADENGQVLFFVAGGAYTIKAEFGNQERTWPFVPIGTAAEYDIDSLAQYLNSGVVYFQTYAALVAYLPLSFPSAGIVLNDPDPLRDGYYTNDGAGWVFGRTMPDTIAKLTIAGGGVNTPTAVVGTGVNPASPLVFYIDVASPNTGSVTLSVTGLGQGVVLNAAGNPLAAGEWQGRVMLTRESDGRYRIMNDPASALSAAQSATQATQQADRAESEADRAEAAAGDVLHSVQYEPQTLTEPQKMQARTNIGAFASPSGTTAEYVRGDGTLATMDSSAVDLGNVANKSEAQMTETGAIADALAEKFDKSGGTVTGNIDATGYIQAEGDIVTQGDLWVGDKNVIAEINAKAGFYAGSDPDEVNYPIGAILSCHTTESTVPLLNEIIVPRLHTSKRVVANFGSGALLTGVWVGIGQSIVSTTQWGCFIQRVR
ncbi:hypothetical protein [Pseudochrobactrum asaccharolyticum]|nr:hypothetical protein [Pseudochrobactrum asaccharolyticum]